MELKKENKAFENDKQLKDLKRHINNAFLAVGQLLYENKENRYYEQLGHPTFESYLGDEELSISRSTAYSLIGIYEHFIITLNVRRSDIENIDTKKLDMIRTKATKENVADLITQARSLSRSDLTAELAGEEPHIEHEAILICRICRKIIEPIVLAPSPELPLPN